MKRILSMLMAIALVLTMVPAAHATEENTKLCADTLEAQKWVREMLLQRVEEFTVKLPIGVYSDNAIVDIYAYACTPTQDPKEGDSLLYQAVPLEAYVDIRSGYAYLTYAMGYLTTVQEEAELDAAMEALISELAVDPKEQHDTVKTLYDWVCANISYVAESEDPYDYTAYGALMNRRATGQGYALLIYQVLTKLGIQCRVIAGTLDDVFHAWNVVAVGDYYYNIDAALDAGSSEYSWFLKSDANMTGHVRDQETIARYLPFCFDDYMSPSEICDLAGHYWRTINCQIPITCGTCGLEKDEYGPHTFGGAFCHEDRQCEMCGYEEAGKEHTYSDEFSDDCTACNHERYITCLDISLEIFVESVSQDDEPQFDIDPAVQVELVKGEQVTPHHYYWTYKLVFPAAGIYRFNAKMEEKEDKYFDILVYEEHQYSEYNGTCMVCNHKNPEFHYHEYAQPTCQVPMTCTICGLTQGEPFDHYFATTDCINIPGVCTMCGLVQEKPVGHIYRDSSDWECDMCGRGRIFGCNEGQEEYWFTGNGFRVLEADEGLVITEGEEKDQDGYHMWQYFFTAAQPGQYEVTLEDIVDGSQHSLSVKIEQHEFREGICYLCGQTDPDVHFHEWIYATCTEPQICATCGLVEGDPTGHSFPNTPCSEDRVCIYCDMVVKAPSHKYSDDLDTDCNFCGQYRATFCEGTGAAIIISGLGEGDFYLVDPPEGVSLVLTEYFVSESIHYWEYVIYSDYAGLYELTLRQKNNEEPMGVTLKVLAHEFDQGVCLNCGTQEGADHIHRWKSATCTEPMTCSVCGETNGEPLNHDYGTYRCAEYAKCGRCGHSRGPVKHTYDDRFDQFCNVCDQQHTTICFGQDLTVAYVNHDQNGFWLENTPDGVKVTLQHTYPYGLNLGYEHVYLLTFSKKGSFELKFVDAEGTEPIYLTVDVVSHSYENGICDGCGKLDESQHVHDWIPANCDFAKTCNICGKQEGSPLGHDFRNGVCTRCEWVNNGIMGDATGDGNINYKDAMLVLRASVGLETLTQEQKAFGDVDGNEKLDYKDAMMILRFSVGLITQWN